MSDDRFTELEMKLAFQEEVIHKLDEALIDQQQQIMALQRQVKLLGNEVRTLDAQTGSQQPEPPPPHY
ncbi:MAG: SlyX protein [Candidatus Azotimanducaceae bacterium]|jgi:SlyX protein